MRALYLIQTYRQPEQIYRLVRTLKQSSPQSFVLLSHNFQTCDLDVSLLKHFSNVEVISTEADRGSFALMQAYLNAINWIFQQQIEFDWLIGLTGQDYPTQPLSQTEQFLATTEYDGFLEHFPAFSPECPWGLGEAQNRYLYHYRRVKFKKSQWLGNRVLNRIQTLINRAQPWVRFNFAFGDLMIGTLALKPPFNSEFVCYGGSYFHTLSRKCVQFLLEFCQKNPAIVDYYRKTCVPDESFIHTVLLNSKRFHLCNHNKRFIDFTGCENGRPRVLTTGDFPALMNEQFHFARKFDVSVDSQILDLLDEHLGRSHQLATLCESGSAGIKTQ